MSSESLAAPAPAVPGAARAVAEFSPAAVVQVVDGARPGTDLVLTIDRSMQFQVE